MLSCTLRQIEEMRNLEFFNAIEDFFNVVVPYQIQRIFVRMNQLLRKILQIVHVVQLYRTEFGSLIYVITLLDH